MGVPPVFEGSCEVMLGLRDLVSVIVRTDEQDDLYLPPGVELVCGRSNLFHVKEEAEKRERETGHEIDPLKNFAEQLEIVSQFYDYILIDTPPDATLPSIACYYAARWYIIACQPQYLNVSGMIEACGDIEDARERMGSPVELLGVLMNCKSGAKVKDELEQIERARDSLPMNANLFSIINRTVKIPQASKEGLSILQLFPSHPQADRYRLVASEVEDRIASRLKAVV